ncbi:MAG: hypothetical protein ACRC7S_14715 [Cetobacterium sp.]
MVNEKDLKRLSVKIEKELSKNEQTYLLGVIEGIKLSKLIENNK